MEWLATRYSLLRMFYHNCSFYFFRFLVSLLRTLNNFKWIPVCHFPTNVIFMSIVICKASETFSIYFLFFDIEKIRRERLFFILSIMNGNNNCLYSSVFRLPVLYFNRWIVFEPFDAFFLFPFSFSNYIIFHGFLLTIHGFVARCSSWISIKPCQIHNNHNNNIVMATKQRWLNNKNVRELWYSWFPAISFLSNPFPSPYCSSS